MAEQKGDITHYQFRDLVDISAFARILEQFFQATGIPNGLVASDGELLTQAGWENVCERFHRVNETTAQRCLDSNQILMHNVDNGKICGKLCGNGLMDYATPVVIEGHKLATLFLGQVLHTPPDMDFFRHQAQQFGFDETEYLKSITEIPIVSKAKMESLMACMVEMAQILAISGLSRYRQDSLEQLTQTMEQDINRHIEKQVQLEDILDSTPVATGWSNAIGKIEYINHQFQHLFGYTLEDIPDLEHWFKRAYPDEHYRETVILPWFQHVSLLQQTGAPLPELEATITCKDGTTRRVLIHVSWVGERRLVNFSDITEHWLIEQRQFAHDSMLEMVAKGSPLSDILNAIVQQVQSEDKSSLCSVLLLDDEGKHLLTGAAPDLPDRYNQAIHGVEIGLGVGSCGTAAYLGERVIVEDIMTHEYWKNCKELAQEAGLYSCWSDPILSSKGKVLGTFAIYHTKPSTPTKEDIERISFASNLASIAIENRQNQKELERRAYYDYLTELANRRHFIELAENELKRATRYQNKLSIAMMDVDHFKQINDTHGHKVGDITLQKLSEISQATLRDIDTIGRIGGEEFAILLPETGPDEAKEAIDRLRIALANAQVTIPDGLPLQFTVSIGITTLNDPKTNIDMLLSQADQALYEAKHAGRNQVHSYHQKDMNTM